MVRVYLPLIYEDVPASKPHKSDYRVSYGIEVWDDDDRVDVLKVQMVRDGAVLGRKVPSFPSGTDDFDRVMDAMKRVRKGIGKKARGQITSTGPVRGLPLAKAKQVIG